LVAVSLLDTPDPESHHTSAAAARDAEHHRRTLIFFLDGEGSSGHPTPSW